MRKYGAYATGITQNVDDLLQSHTARTMLANSEFIVMLNQASTDRLELAKLLNISDTQLSYITNVDAGHGLIKVGSSLVPFANQSPKTTDTICPMARCLPNLKSSRVIFITSVFQEEEEAYQQFDLYLSAWV